MKLCLACVFALCLSQHVWAQPEARLGVSVSASNDLIVVIPHGLHQRYGFSYPMTYEIALPPGSAALKAERRHTFAEPYASVPVKSAGDLFEAVEAARFDYGTGRAYLSLSLDDVSDTLYVRIVDSSGTPLAPTYRGISTYYDNRRAVVTVTADDWADWTDWQSPFYGPILSTFRSFGLYVSAGVISAPSSSTGRTWADIQTQLDSGHVEIVAHSRTHSHTPYPDPVGEVIGCRDDIVSNLTLPALFTAGGVQHVYVWLAPYGDYDGSTDSLLGIGNYLVARLYNADRYGTLSDWDAVRGHFQPINPTLEIGAPSWGGGTTDTTFLNWMFDSIAAQGGVYHFMWHPQVVIGDIGKSYFLNHLNHISRRPDIWYANLGHVYLYHMLQQANAPGTSAVATTNDIPRSARLYQNFPNPFNPATTIQYSLTQRVHVRLTIYSVLGQQVAAPVNAEQEAGTHRVRFDGSNLASGVYFYRLQAGSFVQTMKLTVLK